MNTTSDSVSREQVLALLRGGNAHMPFDEAVADFPLDRINDRAPNVSYSPWQLLEHIRITQEDILEFTRDPDWVSPSWPEGHWPAPDEEADPARWTATINAIRRDLEAMQALVADPANSLTDDLPHAPGYTLLREALLVADHNAYHIGEFAILRQIMGTWPVDRAG
ncbi:MAG: DinB family protein [Chloroflexota bacterium]|nr:DinB family protein [Anaerolineae bacterium]